MLRLFVFFLLAALPTATAEPVSDRAALLSFLSQTPHEPRVNWSSSASTCDWFGVTCDTRRSAVFELHLPGCALVGVIPPNTLGRLSSLRVLSLRSNALSGEVPGDFSNLTSLRSIYLQNNRFSGGFPPSIPALQRLTHLDMSGNNFTGEIPFAVNNLVNLFKLYLQRNVFSGSLPSIDINSLAEFNVSYNKLNGSIPQPLQKFPESSFVGNLQLCGGPLPPCNPSFPPPPAPSPAAEQSPAGNKSSKKLSKGAIAGIAVAAALVALLLLTLLLLCIFLILKRRRRRRMEDPQKGTSPAAETAVPVPVEEVGGGSGGRLVFLGDEGSNKNYKKFELEELLRASAEVLGRGTAGTSYKAVLEDGTTVVVKRLRDVAAAKTEFEEHMKELAKVGEHRNVVPLRAYYYSDDEKLLVYDYLPGASLSSLLHGSRGSGRTPVDWESRMRVAVDAGRGLAHLHSAAVGLPHGNIKASNILLRRSSSPSSSSLSYSSAAVSDYALSPLFSSSTVRAATPAGYRAPEVVDTRRPSFKADVYSYGVLLLELLTGRAPNQNAGVGGGGDEGVDLPRWVRSVVREEWTAEVFDSELMRYPGGRAEEEMVALLQVAMACVATMPDARPDIAEVVKRVEEIISVDDDDGLLRSSGEPTP